MGNPSELSRRRRVVVLCICCMSLLIVALDATIVNVALPAIHRSLHASLSGLQWTVDAYTLVIASLLMLAGSTADRVGRRRVFQIGLAVFSVGSLLCSLAPNLGLLIAFRMVQAVGGSMLNPVAMSIIRNTFEDPRERAQAIGIWAGWWESALPSGRWSGALWWTRWGGGRSSSSTCLSAWPPSRSPPCTCPSRGGRRLDPVGQVLVITMLASVTYAIIEGPSHGWTSAEILGLFAVFAVSLIALIGYELRRREPLIDVRFFRSAPFAGASVISVCAFAALGGFLFLNTLYLQDVRGLSPFHAGLCTLPIAVMTLVFSPLSGRLVGARGARPSLLTAGVGVTVASAMLVHLTRSTPLAYLLLDYVIFGLGFAVVNPPITITAVSGMPAAQAGVAAAVASATRQVGTTLGVAIVGAAVAGGAVRVAGRSFALATHPGWWIIAGLGLAVFVLGLLTTTRWANATAARTAKLVAGESAA